MIRPWLRRCLLALFCGAATAAAADYSREIRPLLAERCLTCHSADKKEGELDLERFGRLEDVQREPAVWERVLEQLESGEMPPAEAPSLSDGQKDMLRQWVRQTLDEIAIARAGDPGPVALRRLSNREYTYTIRDLTGVETLDPAAEFPVDGAAGEGFTNASAALAMSPGLLTKYLDAAKNVARHAVLTPRGIRFSASDSSRDWTDETLARLRAFYARFSTTGNATAVDLQGVKFDTNAGGRLPLEKYLAALQGQGRPEGLNRRYLATLERALTDTKPSLLLDPLRKKFRARQLDAADIMAWQQSLWRFASVGHIGKQNGPKAWQEPVTPLVARHEIRVKLVEPRDAPDVTLYLVASDGGDGSEGDVVIWENARLVAPGRADWPLRDVGRIVQGLQQQRAQVIASVVACLSAAHEAEQSPEPPDVTALARRHGVDAAMLTAWLEYLGIGAAGEVKLEPLIANPQRSAANYDFIQGWTGEQALSVLANSSDATVRIPGTMKGHSVAAHPSPTQAAVIAWRSPVGGELRIEGSVQHAHPECGNGISWALELLRGRTREVLGSGVSERAAVLPLGPWKKVPIRSGDVVALVIGPRDGNHSCDLTAVNLTLHDGQRDWDLARDVSPDILAGNPHADRHGNPAVWHFLSRPAAAEAAPAVPRGSLLALWRQARDAGERRSLAGQVQRLLEEGPSGAPPDSPDRALHGQLLSFNGPLLAAAFRAGGSGNGDSTPSPYGVDPALFGTRPGGPIVEDTSLCLTAPAVIEVKLPAAVVKGAEFVVTGRLHPTAQGSVQMQVLANRPESLSGISAGRTESAMAKGQWSDNNLRTQHSAPVIVPDSGPSRRRFEAAFEEFRNLFPIALCYTRIVPVDEVVTLTLFYREDEPLRRLMLDDAEVVELDQLWEELRFVSEAPLKQVDVFEQLYQFATQDADPAVFEPLRAPILQAAEEFRRQQTAAEPRHVQAVVAFAARAWRRELSEEEQADLHQLYQRLRRQKLSHSDAVRTLIARVLVAPAFLYRGEQPAAGTAAAPVSDWEMATRLSYFLWSSMPDDELRSRAASGGLRDPDEVAAQARRMVKDERIRRLATEFGCQWLQVRDVATLDEKSERHFPTFVELRGDMQEEAVRFFVDLFQADRSVLSLLDADYTFVNGALARHYGLDAPGNGWQRVEGLHARGRGGILGFAATLSRQSGASRTSPILRGTWLSEVILGDKLPNPPDGVPVLPEEAPQGLTERQLTERHSRDERCAGCHRRIDPFGFALEEFDAIGRFRTKDAAGLPIDTRAELPDGTRIEGLDGLRTYLVVHRREAFLRQFCRKLLGYALGRSVQLSDKPLLDTMLSRLETRDYRVGVAIDLIVRSPQFREVRGRDFLASD